MPHVDWGRHKWQIMLGKKWKPYSDQEDLVLKQAYESGQSKCRYDTRGETYEVSFKSFTQLNLKSRKVRWVRNPAIKKKHEIPAKGQELRQQKMAGKKTPAPAAEKPKSKGCCPGCTCCKVLVAVPIIGLIAVAIVGGGDLSEGAETVADAAADAVDAADAAMADLDLADAAADAADGMDDMTSAAKDFDYAAEFDAAQDEMMAALEAADGFGDDATDAFARMGAMLKECDHLVE
jgi:hypothetical protein